MREARVEGARQNSLWPFGRGRGGGDHLYGVSAFNVCLLGVGLRAGIALPRTNQLAHSRGGKNNKDKAKENFTNGNRRLDPSH